MKSQVTSWHSKVTGLRAEGQIRTLPPAFARLCASATTLCCTNFLYPLRSVAIKGTRVSVCGPGTRDGRGTWKLVQKAEWGPAPDKTQGAATEPSARPPEQLGTVSTLPLQS